MAAQTNLPKLTKGHRQAIRKIADGQGTFRAVIGRGLEAAGLAYPASGFSNFIIGCNTRYAGGWRLTELGAACA